MDALSSILGSLGVAASGGIFGVLGAVGGSVVKYFQTKQEQSFKRELWKHEHDTMRLQMEMTSQKGSWDGLKASYEADKVVDNYKWVNAIKSLYRPFLTTILVIVCCFLFTEIVSGLAGENNTLTETFTGSELKEILRYIVYSLVFSTSTAIAWWYCERAIQPPGVKNR